MHPGQTRPGLIEAGRSMVVKTCALHDPGRMARLKKQRRSFLRNGPSRLLAGNTRVPDAFLAAAAA